MNRHSVITIVAILAIIIPFGYSGLNIYAAEQIKFKWIDEKPFSFFEMSNSGKFEFCNPLPIVTSIERLEMYTIYEGDVIGTVSIPSSSIESGQSNIIEGVFSAEHFPVAQYSLMQFDAQFTGASPVRLDPNAFFIIITIDTPIIGVIPYTTSIEYAGFDFYNMMNDELTC